MKCLLHGVVVRIKVVKHTLQKGFCPEKALHKCLFLYLVRVFDLSNIYFQQDEGISCPLFLKILYGTKKLNTWDYLFYLDFRPRVCTKVIYDAFSVLSVLACRGEMMGSGVELWEE